MRTGFWESDGWLTCDREHWPLLRWINRAIWDGIGRDRSAQKAVSAGLLALDVEA